MPDNQCAKDGTLGSDWPENLPSVHTDDACRLADLQLLSYIAWMALLSKLAGFTIIGEV